MLRDGALQLGRDLLTLAGVSMMPPTRPEIPHVLGRLFHAWKSFVLPVLTARSLQHKTLKGNEPQIQSTTAPAPEILSSTNRHQALPIIRVDLIEIHIRHLCRGMR